MLSNLDFIGGVIIAGALYLLPVTLVLYVTLCVVLLFLWRHLLWRLLGARGMTNKKYRVAITVLGVTVFAAVLTWGAYARFSTAEAQPGTNTINSTNQKGGQTGGIINNNGPTYNAPVTVATQPSVVPAKPLQQRSDNCKNTAIRIDGTSGTKIDDNKIQGYDCAIAGSNNKNVEAIGNDISK